MRSADLLTAAIWLVFGLGVAWAGQQLGLGPLEEPGAGFLVFWVGLFMALVAALMLLGTLRSSRSPDRIGELWRGARISTVALAVGALVVYAYLLPMLGFLVASAALLLLLFRTIDPLGWTGALAAAVLGAGGSYLLFKVVLGTQLPAGLVG